MSKRRVREKRKGVRRRVREREKTRFDAVGDVNKDLLGMLSVPKDSRDLSERDLGEYESSDVEVGGFGSMATFEKIMQAKQMNDSDNE